MIFYYYVNIFKRINILQSSLNMSSASLILSRFLKEHCAQPAKSMQSKASNYPHFIDVHLLSSIKTPVVWPLRTLKPGPGRREE